MWVENHPRKLRRLTSTCVSIPASTSIRYIRVFWGIGVADRTSGGRGVWLLRCVKNAISINTAITCIESSITRISHLVLSYQLENGRICFSFKNAKTRGHSLCIAINLLRAGTQWPFQDYRLFSFFFLMKQMKLSLSTIPAPRQRKSGLANWQYRYCDQRETF